MLEWQQRVVDEKATLDGMIDRLAKFLGDPKPETRPIPLAELSRLFKQYDFMRGYSDILGERIAAFTN